MSVHPRVAEALRDAGVAIRDARGLMPLAEARALLRATPAFVKGEGSWSENGFVLDSDRSWAALLSLQDAAELVAEASRLDWQFQPRGMDNVDLHLRYGDEIVPWLATRLDAEGVLHDRPWCVVPCLLACGTQEAFELVWRVRRVDGRAITLSSAWLDRHPATGLRALESRAARGERRARAHLAALRLRAGKPSHALGPPTVDGVLAHLDAFAARLASSAVTWPALEGQGPRRPHGFRAIAARAGDDWGLAIERVEGERRGGLHAARVAVHAFGSRLPAGVALGARPLSIDVRSAPKEGFADWLSERVAEDVEAVVGPVAPSLSALGLPEGASVVSVLTSFAHVAPRAVDPHADAGVAPHVLPSQSLVYRSLASAIAEER